MLFETVKSKNAIWIKDKIGALLSNMVVSASNPKMSVTEINTLDRKLMAFNWSNKTIANGPYYADRILSVINEFYNGLSDDYYSHLAIYIDKRLVQAYIKGKEHLDVSPSQVPITFDKDGKLPYGLKFQYSENYISCLPSSIAPATKKQLDYLKVLAIKNGYYFNAGRLTKEKASSYIDFLKNIDYEIEPDNFDEYYIKAL